MARPQKQTVAYFSHDADASDGRTLTIIFNHYGHEGLSAWWLLLERISGTRNHVISIRNPEDIEFLAAKMHFKPPRLLEILSKLADLDAIDRDCFVAGQLWCQHLIDRLAPVYKARGQPLPIKPGLSVSETELSIPETELSVKKSTQSKLKESKLKESKVYGEFANVLLTDTEHGTLVEKFGATLPEKIESLSIGIASKGYKYKSHYAAILSWERMEQQRAVRQLPARPSPANRIPDCYPTPEELRQEALRR